jgi:uncharacterized membrane protein
MSKAVKPDFKEEADIISRVVSSILSTGIYTTSAFYLTGIILFFIQGAAIPDLHNQCFHTLHSFLKSILGLDPGPFFYLGTVSLILTPISRVGASIVSFMYERDRKFALVTAIVAIIIATSVTIGLVFHIKV